MISVRGLHKRYGRVIAIDGVDIDFADGTVTALVGPNAAGKTTLLKAILGLVRPDRGSIRMNGVGAGGGRSFRERIGYMRQTPHFPAAMTAAELIRMLRRLRSDPRVDESLIDALRLRTEMDKPMGTLSGGTRQKINAVTAFLFRPDALILDEPTAGMDPVASRAFKEKVRAAREAGASVILTSHVVSELQDLADSIALVVEGRIRFSGSRDELAELAGTTSIEDGLARLLEAPPC